MAGNQTQGNGNNDGQSSEQQDNDTGGSIRRVGSLGLAGASLYNVTGSCIQANYFFGEWRGKNGKWNSISWGGNRFTGGRNAS